MAALGLGLVVAATMSAAACAQASGDNGAGRGRILLVLPFDNRSGQPSLEWISEAAPEILGSRFQSAGFAPMSREDRLYALDHLGLPEGFHPSRATALKLAQTLDADSIVVVDSLAWKLTRQLDPQSSVAEETFVAAGRGLRVDAFEQYIRGIAEPDHEERLRHLNQAVALNPAFSPAWSALGHEDYNGQQYEQAAAAFARVGPSDQNALQAGFYRGLSLLFSGDYSRAEQAFGAVARVLPLAEVVNNEGVAASRQGHDGTALFRQAVAADANTADYHFNLAVSLNRHGNKVE